MYRALANFLFEFERSAALVASIKLAKKFSIWFRDANACIAVLVLLVATYLAIVPQQLLILVFESLEVGPGSQSIESAGFVERVIIGTIAAPLFETLLFQWAPIKLLNGVFGVGAAKTILISAALFAITHTYSWGYVIFSFLVGLVLACGFQGRSYQGGNAAVIVFSAHAIRNFVATLARTI